MIKINNVSHHFFADYILRDINLEIKKGELMVLMGPNGMGKSTLLSITAGLMTPFKGKILINGMERRSKSEEEIAIRQQVFYLPDQAWIPHYQTGREYLLMTGKAYGISPVETYEQAAKLLELYNLKDVADNYCVNYSQGQKKKIGLCSAFISKAKTLILDEPFSGDLDSSGLITTKKMLKSLADHDDYTVLMAVPVPELVEEIADKISIIVKGEIVCSGTMPKLKQKFNTQGSLAHLLEKVINPDSQNILDNYLATMNIGE